MDEIEYKIESKNPVLISHAVSKAFEVIKQKCCGQGENISKIPEFKLLVLRLDNTNTMVSMAICHALVELVENGLWDVKEALSSFMSSFSTARKHVARTIALSRLLVLDLKQNTENRSCYQFTLLTPQHPFIVILTADKYGWRTVVNQMKFILNHPDRHVGKASLEMLRPVFLYVLCNPSLDLSDDCRGQVWQLLLKSDPSMGLQTEALHWFCTSEPISCMNSNYRILEFAETAMLQKNEEHCTALLPVIASYTIEVIRHGLDPGSNLVTMLNIISECNGQSGNLSLALMAEVVTICPAIYLYNAVQLCALIAEKMPCHDLFMNVLAAALLKWMAYPSSLCATALDIAKELINQAVSQSEGSDIVPELSSRVFKIFSQSDTHMRFYVEAIRCVNTWDKENIVSWLKDLSVAPMDIRDKCKYLVCGLFLQTSDPQVTNLSCKILVEISREVDQFGSHILSLVLYKLTRSRNTEELKHLLLSLPNLMTTKVNMPIINHTLETLMNGDKQLKYFAIELYLKSLDKEPRFYRFLSTAIIRTMKNDRSWYADATCARALKHICENHPHHGQKLVPLLSEILNRCMDENGGTASALALNSISALCKEAVIGVCSTWQVLAPKMKEENRTIVLEAVCEFLGDVPSHPSQRDEEYEKLIVHAVTQLWKYVVSSDNRVAVSALKALCSYRLEQIPLATLPEEFRRNLVLPAAYAKTPIDAARKPEDVLPYIPGVCWIQMLQQVNKTNLTAAENLLITFIQQELTAFRSQIYVWPQGEPRNFKYLPEKSVIRAVGEFLRRCDKSNSENHRTILQCLRIFAHRYSKPLPNVVWSFLEETIGVSPEAKEYTLRIACNHATMSLSAKSFIENYLANYKTKSVAEPLLQSNEYLILYSNLDHLCQAIPPNILKPFLEVILAHVLEKLNFGSEMSLNLFDRMMIAYTMALKSQDVHDSNSTLLSAVLEKLLEKIDLTSNRFNSYFPAALELSTKHLERMTSPKVWWAITPEKLKNAIAIRAEFALKKCTESPLSWLDEVIEVSTLVPSVQPYLLQTLQRVQLKMQFEKSTPSWVLDLTSQIQTQIMESSEENNNKTLFYFNVLFVSVICLSGMDCMLARKDSLITSQEVRARLFPQAIAILAEQKDWKHVMPEIMEWLNHMRTCRLSNEYKSIFYTALICSRNNPYYKNVWMKYLSVKTAIDI